MMPEKTTFNQENIIKGQRQTCPEVLYLLIFLLCEVINDVGKTLERIL